MLVSLTLSALDLFSLLRAARVCRHWHRAQSTAETWTHRIVHINDVAPRPAAIRTCDFTFPSSHSTIIPTARNPHCVLLAPSFPGVTVDPPAAAPLPLSFTFEQCARCLLPLRHLQIDTDNALFLPSFAFIPRLTSLRTLTVHLTLSRYRSLHSTLCSLTAPTALTSITVLLDLLFKEITTVEPELPTLPAHVPLHLHLHMRGFTSKWEDDWVDGWRRWRAIEALDISVKAYQSLTDEHLMLILQGEEERSAQQADQDGNAVVAMEEKDEPAAPKADSSPRGQSGRGSAASSLQFPRLRSLNMTGQSHLFHHFFSLLPLYLPGLSCLVLTNCMGTDNQTLLHLSALPQLEQLTLTLHENISDTALHGFLAATPQLRDLHLSARSQQRRKTHYFRPLCARQLLAGSTLTRLTLEASIKLRVVEATSCRLEHLDWEGGCGGAAAGSGGPVEDDSAVIAWMLRLQALRVLVLRLTADEWEEAGELGDARRAVMTAGLQQLAAQHQLGSSHAMSHLDVIRVSATEARLSQWRSTAPHICFSPL